MAVFAEKVELIVALELEKSESVLEDLRGENVGVRSLEFERVDSPGFLRDLKSRGFASLALRKRVLVEESNLTGS